MRDQVPHGGGRGHGPIADTDAGPRPDSLTPLLLLVGSGDRRYREYLVAGLRRRYRLWLLDPLEPTWQTPYLVGSTVVDTRDGAALADAAAAIPAGHGRPVGMLSYDEWSVEATARAAYRLGLPTAPPGAVAACRDKSRTRRLLDAAGVPQPRSVVVGDADEAVAAAQRIGYPVVVKARRLAGSIGVVRADDAASVRRAFPDADAATFPGVEHDGADVLVEEYLPGPEISVDSAVVDGAVVPLVLARKQVGLHPYFEEVGHVVDAADPLLTDDALLDQLRRVHAGIGFTRGMTHTEFRLTPAGPRLIEINARLGGDFIPYLGQLATGVDLAAVAGDVAAGVVPSLTPTRRRVAAIGFHYPPDDCEVVEAVVHQAPPGSPIHAAVATASPGQRMRLPPRGYLSRYGYLIVITDSVEQAHAALDANAGLVELRSKPLDWGSSS